MRRILERKLQKGRNDPATIPRWASRRVLTHKGGVPCNMHTGALVPRRSTAAGVPGPRRNADECDAGWFAPVATRRRSMLGPFSPRRRLAVLVPGGYPPDPRSLYARAL